MRDLHRYDRYDVVLMCARAASEHASEAREAASTRCNARLIARASTRMAVTPEDGCDTSRLNTLEECIRQLDPATCDTKSFVRRSHGRVGPTDEGGSDG